MTSLDNILNAVIPWVIAIIGIYVLYRPLKGPLSPLFRGIGNFFGTLKEKISGGDKDEDLFIGTKTIEYE